MDKKTEKTKKTSGSRSGKHRPELVMLGGLVEPRKKAIAMITASIIAGDGRLTVIDLMWRGIENIARAVGVLDANGEVSEKYRDTVRFAELTISENQKKTEGKVCWLNDSKCLLSQDGSPRRMAFPSTMCLRSSKPARENQLILDQIFFGVIVISLGSGKVSRRVSSVRRSTRSADVSKGK